MAVVTLIAEFWKLPDNHHSFPVLIFSRELEVPAPPRRGRRAYWNTVAEAWLAEHLQGLTTDGPKQAVLRRKGRNRVVGVARRVHRNIPEDGSSRPA